MKREDLKAGMRVKYVGAKPLEEVFESSSKQEIETTGTVEEKLEIGGALVKFSGKLEALRAMQPGKMFDWSFSIMVQPEDLEPLESQPAEEQRIADEIIGNFVGAIRRLSHDIDTKNGQLNRLKGELASMLEKRGANWSDAEGYARLISAGVRASYSTDALDALLISDPLRYGWLKDYRKEVSTTPRVMVK